MALWMLLLHCSALHLYLTNACLPSLSLLQLQVQLLLQVHNIQPVEKDEDEDEDIW